MFFKNIMWNWETVESKKGQITSTYIMYFQQSNDVMSNQEKSYKFLERTQRICLLT